MIWQFDIIILIFMVVTAIIALQLKDLLAAVVVFGLTTSTILTLFVLPSVYGLFHPKPR